MGGWELRGWGDTPFDEVIYSRNHSLRAPGCCKRGMATVVPALVPIEVICVDGLMVCPVLRIEARQQFSAIFPLTDEGFDHWKAHLVTALRGDQQRLDAVSAYLLTMKPGNHHPWHRARCVRAPTGNLMAFDMTLVGFDASRRFEERRLGVLALGAPTGNERSLILPGMRHRAPAFEVEISPNTEFCGEDGCWKKFSAFRVGDFIRHDHFGNGVERRASASVYPGGFRCFVCNVSYGVAREQLWADPYVFYDDEITTNDDPVAYMPDLDWENMMNKKYIIIGGPMGSGKTEQVVRLVDRLTNDNPNLRVLLVAFRRMLAIQQVGGDYRVKCCSPVLVLTFIYL